MGLLRAGSGAAGGVLADQWRDFFYCDALPADILVAKGKKRITRRSSNRKGEENIISNGAVIAVNEGQCMLLVDQGRVVEVCAEAGEFVYESSTEPSVFYGTLSETIVDTFKAMGERFAFGGDPGKDQRLYYCNTKEIMGNKYGTPNPVPFRVVDEKIGLDVDISIRCHGEYSYRITNPVAFYGNVSGNILDAYRRTSIDPQLKTELMTALQPAFAQISAMGVRYSALPGHTAELADALNQELNEKWRALRGIEIVSIGISSVNASEEDEAMIKELQKSAVLRNPGMAAARLVDAQAIAMQEAAKNPNTGPILGFAGMDMAQRAGGVNTKDLFAMAQPAPSEQGGSPQPANAPKGTGWKCSNCNHADNAGRFCSECGSPMPEDEGWHCGCGEANKGKFCTECGKARPVGASLYRCDKCGWEPENPAHPPKFCPECGDAFDENDLQK